MKKYTLLLALLAVGIGCEMHAMGPKTKIVHTGTPAQQPAQAAQPQVAPKVTAMGTHVTAAPVAAKKAAPRPYQRRQYGRPTYSRYHQTTKRPSKPATRTRAQQAEKAGSEGFFFD